MYEEFCEDRKQEIADGTARREKRTETVENPDLRELSRQAWLMLLKLRGNRLINLVTLNQVAPRAPQPLLHIIKVKKDLKNLKSTYALEYSNPITCEEFKEARKAMLKHRGRFTKQSLKN